MAELCTHTYTQIETRNSLSHALCNTGVFTFHGKQQQQPAAFPTAPSITRQSLTRVFQWLLCEHRSQERFPALCCPRWWLSVHTDKARPRTSSPQRAPDPTGGDSGRAGSGGAGAGWAAAVGAGSELQLYYGLHQSGGRVTAWFGCVGQTDPGDGVSRLRRERWSALSPLQIETMM